MIGSNPRIDRDAGSDLVVPSYQHARAAAEAALQSPTQTTPPIADQGEASAVLLSAQTEEGSLL